MLRPGLWQVFEGGLPVLRRVIDLCMNIPAHGRETCRKGYDILSIVHALSQYQLTIFQDRSCDMASVVSSFMRA
jgi:hypothetical protein